MLNSMLGVILRFREGLYAMVGDISKMSHSIIITKKDQMMRLFLWRDLDLSKPVDTYAMTAVNFGCKPSGSIAMTALRKTAEMCVEDYPTASGVIVQNSYMDDISACADSIEERDKLKNDIDVVLAKGGFRIKGWVCSKNLESGNEQVIQEESLIEVKEVDTGGGGSEMFLDMMWDTNNDRLFFQVKMNQNILIMVQVKCDALTVQVK